jgi:hypothetical protein
VDFSWDSFKCEPQALKRKLKRIIIGGKELSRSVHWLLIINQVVLTLGLDPQLKDAVLCYNETNEKRVIPTHG